MWGKKKGYKIYWGQTKKVKNIHYNSDYSDFLRVVKQELNLVMHKRNDIRHVSVTVANMSSSYAQQAHQILVAGIYEVGHVSKNDPATRTLFACRMEG